MSRTYKHKDAVQGRGGRRNLSVRAVRRDPPDVRKLSRALIQLALVQAAAEAAAQRADTEPRGRASTGGPADV
ncbi:hypothetical protein GCM10023225_09630 [Kineococcus glutinatus]|uniref:Uncharacterized protein n=1 Tax=Kineococcus glutinatus TaxID=1070872 RepID=A0ABP9HF54_9ACTN